MTAVIFMYQQYDVDSGIIRGKGNIAAKEASIRQTAKFADERLQSTVVSGFMTFCAQAVRYSKQAATLGLCLGGAA